MTRSSAKNYRRKSRKNSSSCDSNNSGDLTIVETSSLESAEKSRQAQQQLYYLKSPISGVEEGLLIEGSGRLCWDQVRPGQSESEEHDDGGTGDASSFGLCEFVFGSEGKIALPEEIVTTEIAPARKQQEPLYQQAKLHNFESEDSEAENGGCSTSSVSHVTGQLLHLLYGLDPDKVKNMVVSEESSSPVEDEVDSDGDGGRSSLGSIDGECATVMEALYKVPWIKRDRRHSIVIPPDGHSKSYLVSDLSQNGDHCDHGPAMSLEEEIPLKKCRLPKFAVHQTMSTLTLVFFVQNVDKHSISTQMCTCHSFVRIAFCLRGTHHTSYRIVFGIPDLEQALDFPQSIVYDTIRDSMLVVYLHKAPTRHSLWPTVAAGAAGSQQLKIFPLFENVDPFKMFGENLSPKNNQGSLELQRRFSVPCYSSSTIMSSAGPSQAAFSLGDNSAVEMGRPEHQQGQEDMMLELCENAPGSSNSIRNNITIGAGARGILKNSRLCSRTLSECSENLEFSSWDISESLKSSGFHHPSAHHHQLSSSMTDFSSAGVAGKKSVHFSNKVVETMYKPGTVAIGKRRNRLQRTRSLSESSELSSSEENNSDMACDDLARQMDFFHFEIGDDAEEAAVI